MKLCDYIFKRLKELGTDDIFCLPGESVQDLYHALLKSNLKSVLLSHEPSVGYAADAYSRLKGLGAVLVSYGVGSLNLVNPVSQAYAESSPMIVLSGGPGMNERKKYSLLHHKVRTFQTQKEVFDEITAMSIIIDSPIDAVNKLEMAFQTALKYKKPVYIEIPRDISNCQIADQPLRDNFEESEDHSMIEEALEEVIELINQAKKPVILAGVEISRIKMQNELLELVEKTGLPVASTLLGKSVISETHPQSLGTFFGKLANENAQKHLEEADLIVSIGAILSDVSLGMFTFQIDRTKMIEARIDNLKVKHHYYPEVNLKSFMKGLLNHSGLKKREVSLAPKALFFLEEKLADQKISTLHTQSIINQFINRPNSPAYRIVSDVGDCLFIGQELLIGKLSSFLSPAYYLSMGFGVPGGIGAQIADPSQRSLILVGDGAFQMTGLEIVSANRLKLNPIIILLNNGNYATLECVEPEPLEEGYKIGKYDYYKMAEIFGGAGYRVESTKQLENALQESESKHQDKFVIIQVELAADDTSKVLRQFGENMGKSNKQASSGVNSQ